MLNLGAVVDNQTIMDTFGVANSGGIRSNLNANHIVLVSHKTNSTYQNAWKDDVLHFVGQGSGDQTLTRNNKTLSNAPVSNAKLYLFEVFKKKEYTYAGPVKLDAGPYEAQQADESGAYRTVWIFPLRKIEAEVELENVVESRTHLPYGAYAVISDNLTEAQKALVDAKLDELSNAGVSFVDKRQITYNRYGAALGSWHSRSMAEFRSLVRAKVEKERSRYKKLGKPFSFTWDEIVIEPTDDENRLREVLDMIGLPDEFDRLKAKAFDSVKIPNLNSELPSQQHASEPVRTKPPIDFDKLKDIT